MKKIFKSIFVILILIVLSSCASKYFEINPKRQQYYSKIETAKLSINYKANILQESNNNKYYTKAKRKGITLVVAEIINRSNETFYLSKDIQFTDLNKNVNLLDASTAFELIKQNPWVYYLSLLSVSVPIGASNGNTAYIGISPLALVYAIPNSIIASKANKKLFNELSEYEINNKALLPYDTAHVILCIEQKAMSDFSFKLIKGGQAIITKHNSVNLSFELDSVLYYSLNRDSTYDSYLNNLKLYLKNRRDFIEANIDSKKYKDGKLKSVGLSVRHFMGNPEYYHSVGTWKYYHPNGQLKETVDYDIFGRKIGKDITYNENGLVDSENIFFVDRNIYCSNCILNYNENINNDVILLKSGENINCYITKTDDNYVYYDSQNIVKNNDDIYTSTKKISGKVTKDEVTSIVCGKH